LKRTFNLYLQDILEAIERVEQYTQGMNLEEFSKSKITIDAVLRNLEIIGEAATQLPKDKKEKYNKVPWEDIQNFRIVAAHHYWKIDKVTIWDIIENQLNILSQQIQEILEKEDLEKQEKGREEAKKKSKKSENAI